MPRCPRSGCNDNLHSVLEARRVRRCCSALRGQASAWAAATSGGSTPSTTRRRPHGTCEVLLSVFLPRPIVLLSRRFRENCPGPVPRLIGMTVSPAWGLVSNVPHRVLTILVPVAPAASVGGTIVEDGIAVIVLAGGDVERRPRVRHHERAQPDSFGQRKRSSQEQAMPDVKRGAAVIQRDIIGIGREGTDARGVAVGKIQGVKPEQGKSRAQTEIEVRDELVLIEEAIRLVLVNVPYIRVGPRAGGRRAGGIAGERMKRKCREAAR